MSASADLDLLDTLPTCGSDARWCAPCVDGASVACVSTGVTGVGGGAGWLIGRYAPMGEAQPDSALVSRIEALENQSATTDQLDTLQARLAVVEEESAGAPLRTDAFEQLIRRTPQALVDRGLYTPVGIRTAHSLVRIMIILTSA